MDFFEQLSLTVLGFVLTYVVGSWLTSAWQTRSWHYQREYESRKELVKVQTELVEALGNLIGKRLSRMQRVLSALRGGDESGINNNWDANDKVVLEWNDNLSGFVTKLRQNFSTDEQYYFEERITYLISNTQEKLYKQKNSFARDKSKLTEIQSDLRLIRHETNLFLQDLWSVIERSNKYADGIYEIDHVNNNNLTYLFLIKSLFKLRIPQP